MPSPAKDVAQRSRRPLALRKATKEKEPKGQIILAVGLPGSGKSTYFARRGIQPLSSDMLRLWLLDDATNQLYQRWVFLALRYLLRLRLLLGRPRNYIDATNLTRKERRYYFRMGARYGYQLCALYFDVPVAVCQERNRRRNRQVPKAAMEQLAQRLSPPALEEGFAKITIVRPRKANKP